MSTSDTEPELIAWVRAQIMQDIDQMTAILEQPLDRQPLVDRLLRRHDRKTPIELQEEADRRLPNRQILLAMLGQHPHDILGCLTCGMTVRPRGTNRWCATILLLAALYRSRPGYRSSWQRAAVDLLPAHINF